LAAASQGTPPARRALNRIGRPVTELLPVPDSIRNYRQLAGHLRELISTGLLGAGALLPSAAELARHLGLAKSTVHRAITALGQDGCIERVGNRWSVSRSVESEPDVMVGKA
jgi:DNA-binding GntR family transcriptional regulator